MLQLLFLALLVALVTAVVFIVLAPLRVLGFFGNRGVSRRRGVEYGPLPRHRLDTYTSVASRAAAPVVIFFHGGGWSIGDKDEYAFVGQSLARSGFVVVLPNYRLSPQVVFPTFLEDAALAVAAVVRRYHSRPVFLAGHSSGAHIAAMLALDRRYLDNVDLGDDAISGVIGLSGPYDFLPLTEEKYERTFPEETREDSQPINFVDGSAPPMLLVTGEDDHTVNPGNTTRLAAAIMAQGGEVTVKTYPGFGHLAPLLGLASAWRFRKPPVRRDLIAFIEQIADR